MAGRGDGSAQSQDSVVLSFLHPAIRQPGQRACVLSVRRIGNCVGYFEHFCGSARNFVGGTAWKKDSILGSVSEETENGDRRHYDWTGNVSGHERKSLNASHARGYNSKI